MNSYEVMLIFDPNLGEERIGADLTKTEDKIKALGGEITKTDKWGTKKLASRMMNARKLQHGHYILIFCQGPGTLPAQLSAFLKINEGLIRYAVIRAEEKAAAESGAAAPDAAGIEAVNVGEIKEVAPAGGNGGQS